MRGKDLSSLDWKAVTDKEMVAYEAHDAKGRGHYLVRNRHKSEMMFVISDGLTVTPGWYTDRGGTIRRVS
ncbi:MAG: hypothetical protein A2X80_07865 [Geobacteraceae bacterium GWB2_52_12]|nr:MAG: hypothetical protein A2X80_07865 [Geobacteraceae bacterium GWB2_52_12]